MIRVGGKEGAALYAVAEPSADVAVKIIQSRVATKGEYVEEGRVEDQLLSLLHLASGEFKRV